MNLARRRLFLIFIAVLPLHTVVLSAWISWKPLIVFVAAMAIWDLTDWLRTGTFPWSLPMTIVLSVFLLIVLAGWPEAELRERFVRLFLALVVGALVLLTTERSVRTDGVLHQALHVAFWTGAAIGLSAVLLELVALGTFGNSAHAWIEDLPGVYRVAKKAYLEEGFYALTNWHQDPGYSAAWSNMWIVLTLGAIGAGRASGNRWIDGGVLGGLIFTVIMAFSRTGWIALPIVVATSVVVLFRRRPDLRSRILATLGIAMIVAALLAGAMFLLDKPDVGGDIALQFDFRFSQGLDLLSDITGLFSFDTDFADAFDVSEERADVWPEYAQMFRDHPLTGVGLSVGWQTNSIAQEPHNLILELLAETGLIGMAAFLAILVVAIRRGSGWLGGAALLAALLPMITQTVLFEPTWWFAAGLLAAGAGNKLPEVVAAD